MRGKNEKRDFIVYRVHTFNIASFTILDLYFFFLNLNLSLRLICSMMEKWIGGSINPE